MMLTCIILGHTWVMGERIRQCTRCGKTQKIAYDGLNIYWDDIRG